MLGWDRTGRGRKDSEVLEPGAGGVHGSCCQEAELGLVIVVPPLTADGVWEESDRQKHGGYKNYLFG